MIILIGGPSCTGKTLLAQRMLERYHMPYLSIDHLKMGLIRSGRCDFKVDDTDEKIASEMWPILKGMIMTCVENRQHMIIEGCYFLPELIRSLDASYLREVHLFYLIFKADYIRRHFESKIITHRSVIEQRLYDETRPLTQVIAEHEKIRQLCLLNDVTYFEIEDDYETEIARVFGYFDGFMRDKEEI